MIYLDTHVVVWLFAGELKSFSANALNAMQENDLCISPMVRLELQYLFEIERTKLPAEQVLNELKRTIGLTICDLPFLRVIEEAEARSWTRDPFDRIIVAQAALQKSPLVTKDQSILRHYPLSIWD